jgi:hypothetical protein
MIRRPRLRHLLAAAVTIGALASAVPAASASTSAASAAPTVTMFKVTKTGIQPVSSTENAGALGKLSASPAVAPACQIIAFGYTGYAPCDTYGYLYAYPADNPHGTYEMFIIGTNYKIYHAWPGGGGFRSLGGLASNASGNGVDLFGTYSNGLPIVDMYGTNGLLYCDAWGAPNWSGWHQCYYD